MARRSRDPGPGRRGSGGPHGHGKRLWQGISPCHKNRRKQQGRNGGDTRSYGNEASTRGSSKNVWGGHTGSLAESGFRPEPTPHAYSRERGTGQAPCYALARVHSPVRYIPAPRIGRARVGIQPGRMVPAQHAWPPVRLFGPGYPAPALRTVSLVRLHSPVRPVPAKITIQPGGVVPALRSRPPVRLHGPVCLPSLVSPMPAT